MKELKIGLIKKCKREVKREELADKVGSGVLEVYSTPSMIAFMEYTSEKCVNSLLEEGETTVGIAVDIKHIKATLLAKKVECIAELIEIDGKKLKFKLTVSDEEGKIGIGNHTRFIVNSKEFMEKIK